MGAQDGEETRARLALIGEIAAEIAHELRNTMQIVSSSAYVARQAMEHGHPEAARPHVVKVEKYARVAHEIIDDLLLLARAEPPTLEPTPVADAIAAAREGFAPRAAEWADDVEPLDLRVAGHPGLLARLLHVLYENAIQASPQPPHIRTRARAEPGRAVIEVQDDGPGIAADVAPHVFEPFVTARPGGTGLGLALARRIAAAHGGSIALAAAGYEGGGARFRIELLARR